MGAKAPRAGSGVNADAAICSGFAGLTAILGSLSWFSSPLSDFGIILMSRMDGTEDFEAPFLPDSLEDFAFRPADFFAAGREVDFFLVVRFAADFLAAMGYLLRVNGCYAPVDEVFAVMRSMCRGRPLRIQ